MGAPSLPFLAAADASPFASAATVTPNDGTDLPGGVTRGVYIGGAGGLKVGMADGTTLTFAAVPLGVILLRVKRIYATGTAATNIVALY